MASKRERAAGVVESAMASKRRAAGVVQGAVASERERFDVSGPLHLTSVQW